MPEITPTNSDRAKSAQAHAQAYVRSRDLPRLIPLWPSEIEDPSRAGGIRLIAKLRRALREERCRGVAGHWAYDLARHAALLEAFRRECDAILGVAKEKAAGQGVEALTQARVSSRGPSSARVASVRQRS